MLSRLTDACNPESIPSGSCSASGPWSDVYTYDADGNVLTKTAPLPNQSGSSTVTATMTYDELNRVKTVTYSDGITPGLYYWYDVAPSWMTNATNLIGRLANSSNAYGGGTSGQATATAYSYDAMGRALEKWQQTPSVSPGGLPVYSTFDLVGNLTTTTTAAGTAITHWYDSANRLTKVTSGLNDAQHPPTLYTVDASVGYYPSGALRKATYGNGLTETFALNNRLQPCRMNLNSSGSYYSNCTSSTPTGNVVDYTLGYNAGLGDNGNVVSWTAGGQQAFTRSYTYDNMNRLQTMTDSASGQACKGLSWTVDAWGNLTAQTPTGGTCFTFSSGASTNNRLNSYQYDAAGNVLYDGSHHYTYSAEGQILTADDASYVYNENGQRVRKNTSSGWTEYFYGPNGSVQSEYNGSWPAQYVYAGSRLLAIYQNGTTDFVHSDHLGSTRLLSSITQAIVDNMDYEPFGQQTSGGGATTHKFTGKERDAESGLDYFGARYYASVMGRWLSPDWSSSPSGVPYADLSNPQSLNLYGYMRNNPLGGVDADGHWPIMQTWDPNWWRGEGQNLAEFGKGVVEELVNTINLIQSDHALPASSQIPVIQPRSPAEAVGMISTSLVLGAASAPTGLETTSATLTETIAQDTLQSAASLTGSRVATMVGAYDTETGSVAVGTSGPLSRLGAINPQLSAAADQVGGVGSVYPGAPSPVGCCAEFDAANQLTNQGSKLGDIQFTDAIRPRTGAVIPKCTICEKMFPDK